MKTQLYAFLAVFTLCFLGIAPQSYADFWEGISLTEEDWAKAKLKLARIQNYEEIKRRPDIMNAALRQIARWEKLLNREKVPEMLRLPPEMLCLSTKPSQVHFVPDFKYVCYVPDVDLLYGIPLAAHEALLEYGEDAPHSLVYLSILCQETYMRDIPGDGGHSFGHCQLYGPTAEYILSENYGYRGVFARYVGLRSWRPVNQRHFFKGKYKEEKIMNMLHFMTHFLILGKGYKKGSEKEGLWRYNGARSYGVKLRKRMVEYATLLYDERFMKFSPEEFYEKHLSNMQWFTPSGYAVTSATHSPVQEERFRSHFLAQLVVAASAFPQPQKLGHPEEPQSPAPQQGGAIYVPKEQENTRFYIIPEKGRSLFSYFRQDTYKAILYHNQVNKSPSLDIALYVNTPHAETGKRFLNTESELLDALKENPKNIRIHMKHVQQRIYVRPGGRIFTEKGKPYVSLHFLEEN
jgi:hypothetical protein